MNMEFKDLVDTRLLAGFLEIEYKKLTYILYGKRVENFYITFEIPKKNGEMRCINAPKNPLKHVQRNLAKKLAIIQRKHYLKNNICQGFTSNRSIITNSKIHRNKKYVLNLDLENFFDSFHFGRVKGYFQKNKNFMLPEKVAMCIANIACYNRKLPQGAPSSPIITNLICAVMDRRLAIIAKKYRMIYTRYADDLTFSTNSKYFLDYKDDFLKSINGDIEKSGFKLNKSKTRILLCDSRQEVTGLVVNRKISVKREFCKETRSMLHHLYAGLPIKHNGNELSQKQLEGRLAFINQIDWYNNIYNNIYKNIKKTPQKGFNTRENQYRRFLFFKYFYYPEKPLIVTEGKTDVVYIRAALRKLYRNYPLLIKQREDGSLEYLVTFFKRTSRLRYFLGIDYDGADTMKNIYNQFLGYNNYPDLFASINKYGLKPRNPIILLFDNEQINKKPLKIFLDHIRKSYKTVSVAHDNVNISLEKNTQLQIFENLYISTIPLVGGKGECEIEDLFTDDVLKHTINGKKFSRKGEYGDKGYSKEIFASYVKKNINEIDFNGFIPLLDGISDIVTNFNKIHL